MEKISLKRNASLNGVRTVFAILFPLITFPYATRVLQVANLGKVNFSSSIVNYFLLMAGLGVATYAIREGAGLRNDPEKLNEFGVVKSINTALQGNNILGSILGSGQNGSTLTTNLSKLASEQMVNGLFYIVEDYEKQNSQELFKALGK